MGMVPLEPRTVFREVCLSAVGHALSGSYTIFGIKECHPCASSIELSSSSPFSWLDRKSTRLNSSHLGISYAVFCLKKKNIYNIQHTSTPQTQHTPVPSAGIPSS